MQRRLVDVAAARELAVPGTSHKPAHMATGADCGSEQKTLFSFQHSHFSRLAFSDPPRFNIPCVCCGVNVGTREEFHAASDFQTFDEVVCTEKRTRSRIIAKAVAHCEISIC